jgi:hypothetical protein
METASRFKRPVFVILDVSAYEFCQKEELRSLEHEILNRMCKDPLLAGLLKAQRVNRIRFMGYKLQILWRRMSGEMTTSLGNNMISCFVGGTVVEILKQSHGVDAALKCDGDDALIICEEDEAQIVVRTIAQTYKGSGLKLKMVEVATIPEQCEFCSSRIVETAYGRTLVRSPQKVAACIVHDAKPHLGRRARHEYLASKALCELHANAGVPVLFTLASSILRHCLNVLGKDKLWLQRSYMRILSKHDPDLAYRASREVRGILDLDMEIPLASRMSFYLAFGVTPEEQVYDEDLLAKFQWDFSIAGTILPESNPSNFVQLMDMLAGWRPQA